MNELDSVQVILPRLLAAVACGAILGVDRVHGLTTSASIWLSSIMGITCGMGQWRLAGVSFVLAFVLLLVGRSLEHAIVRWAGPSAERPSNQEPT